MASFSGAVRATASLARQHCQQRVISRTFRTFAPDHAAHNYTMPALSPTMTEGNIANWQVKEGDSYTAGDVLLEIETDKATMDVEAQDDGILMKIISPNGSKAVKVGQRIAVTAEPGDDIKTLELPADEESAATKAPEKSSQEAPKKEQSQVKSEESGKSGKSEEPARNVSDGGQAEHQTKPSRYPLYPSVEHLLHENGLSESDAQNIRATGPGGRLLKGDVLAHLGKISKDYPEQSSARLEKLSHLDLSNIKLAPKQEKAADSAQKRAEPAAEEQPDVEVGIPIDLTAVQETQQRVQKSLGIYLPLSTFISKASELANQDLPLGKRSKPTTNDLFNAVLGLDKVRTTSKGNFFPLITGPAPTPAIALQRARKSDIIDILAAKVAKGKSTETANPTAIGLKAGENMFSVLVKTGEERRAEAYLVKMKSALEEEAGRLIL